MNLSMQLAVLVAAACLCLADASPELRLVRKQQRPTRGFRPGDLMTARGFGKRDSSPARAEQQDEVGYATPVRREYKPQGKLMVGRDFGKREDDEVYGIDNFWETMESSPEKDGQEGEKNLESIPVDWFVNELLNNPNFARSVVRKFVDVNQDGMLSAEELLRNVN